MTDTAFAWSLAFSRCCKHVRRIVWVQRETVRGLVPVGAVDWPSWANSREVTGSRELQFAFA